MRILLLNQFFHPDAAPTGELLADVALDLAAHDHEVVVISGRQLYASNGHQPAGARATAFDRLTVVRVPGPGFRRDLLTRLTCYLCYLAGAVSRAVLASRFDLVVTLTTPPFLPLVGTLLKYSRHSRHIIWEMDLYPDIAVDTDTLRPTARLTRLFERVLDCSRRHADRIIALGPCMRERLLRHSVEDTKIVVAENWADGQGTAPQPITCTTPLTILYSGNLGIAHETDTISSAFAMPGVRFVFSGGGSRRIPLEEFCRRNGYENVIFRPYMTLASLREAFREAHVGLVTQQANCCGSVVPSKVYTVMAAGRPVLFIGPRNATPARIVEQFRCGWQIDPGDVNSLRRLLDILIRNPSQVREAGEAARRAFNSNYDRPLGVARICSIFEAVLASPAVSRRKPVLT